MLGMAMNSAKLLFAGKLFKDYGKVIRQILVAIVSGVAVLYGVSLVAPLWVAAIAGGAVAGFLQPILFKDLKYA